MSSHHQKLCGDFMAMPMNVDNLCDEEWDALRQSMGDLEQGQPSKEGNALSWGFQDMHNIRLVENGYEDMADYVLFKQQEGCANNQMGEHMTYERAQQGKAVEAMAESFWPR